MENRKILAMLAFHRYTWYEYTYTYIYVYVYIYTYTYNAYVYVNITNDAIILRRTQQWNNSLGKCSFYSFYIGV